MLIIVRTFEQCVLFYRVENNSSSLASAIQTLRKNVDDDSVLHIEVRRGFILSDAIKEAHKKKFNPKKIKVQCAYR